MEIGTRVTLEMMETDDEIIKYHCKIIEKIDNFIIVDYPINLKNNKTAFLPIGTKLRISYNNKNAVYQFTSMIAKKINAKIPALAIPLPEKGEMKRIQRRRFVRIDASLDVAIHSLNNCFTPFTSVTLDISGGGLSVLVQNKETVSIGDKVKVFLVLPISGKSHYVIVEGEIVFVKSQNKMFNASIKFLNINNKDQQDIIQYCFEIERERKNKELL